MCSVILLFFNFINMLKWFEKLTDKELQKLLAKNKYDYFIDYDNNVYKKLYKAGKLTFFEYTTLPTTNSYYIMSYNSNIFISPQDNSYIPKLIPLTYDYLKKYLVYSFDNLNISTIVYKIAKKHYGENNVELSKDEKYLTIYYPEIIIESDSGLNHVMKDVYVDIKISPTRLTLDKLYRGTLSSAECRQEYLFSHCIGNLTDSNTFCYGDSNIAPMNQIFQKHRDKKNLLTNIDYLFYILDSYLSWESTEGVPYRYISNLKRDDNFYQRCYNDTKKPYKKIKEYVTIIINKLTSFGYYYTSLNELHLDLNTIEQIYEISKQFDDEKRIIRNGEECTINQNNTHEQLKKHHENSYVLTFKGEDVKLKIENDDPEIQYTTGLSTRQIQQIINYIEEKIKFILWQKHQEQLILTQ